MASKLMHDGGAGKTPWYNNSLGFVPKATKDKVAAANKPKPKPKLNATEYGSATGGKYNPKNTSKKVYTQTKASHNKPKVGVAKPKAKAGGALGSGGKFYKNGYVDSKGNKVVNGKWVSPKAPVAKKSTGGSVKTKTAPKKTVVPKTPAPKTPAPKVQVAKASAPAKPKISLLADDYMDQIYRNQIAELDDADKAFGEDNTAKVKRLGRDFNLNSDNVELNRTNSLQNSAEDYAARGMMRSGAYSENLANTSKLFNDQKSRMQQNFNDDNAEYTRAKSDFLRGSGVQRQDAKRQQADRIAVENAKRAANASS